MRQTVVAIILSCLVVASLVLRLYKLGELPAGLNRDEAALAYNGYLLSETGKDEWGVSWPLTLQSFGDYKLIGYPAVLSLLFSFLPENDTVVRLPSAVFGSLLVIAAYYFARTLSISRVSALAVAATVAVTPVFVFYSRIAFEAVVALTLLVAAVSLLIRTAQKPKVSIDILALLMLLLALLVYNTPLLLLPFVLAVVPVLRGLRNYTSWVPVCVAGAVIWISFYLLLSSAIQQKTGITIFTDETVTIEYPAYREQFSGIFTQLLGNKYVYYLLIAGKNVLETFSYEFLVDRGGEHPWHTLLNWGHIYIVSYLLGLLGLLWLALKLIKHSVTTTFSRLMTAVAQPLSTPHKVFLILYLAVVATIPSIITVDSPHATRSLFFFVVLLVSGGYFLDLLFTLFRKLTNLPAKYSKLAVLGVIAAVTAFSAFKYVSEYFTLYPEQSRQLFQAGRETILKQAKQKYVDKPIAVIDEAGYDYILVSWYLLLPPEEYFATTVRQQADRIGFRYGERVGQFHFIARRSDMKDEAGVIYWNGTSWALE